ncbi:hypothetical protein [Sporolactobacillus sp. KGMB 08714]|uniref:hypothetical protein n=1 Tax=Sporolactobacillus sp. KGMB 08714 TaxID=3064704 RepID=UPI002FBD3F8F
MNEKHEEHEELIYLNVFEKGSKCEIGGDYGWKEEQTPLLSFGIHQVADSCSFAEHVNTNDKPLPDKAYIKQLERQLTEIKYQERDIRRDGVMAIPYRHECLERIDKLTRTETKKNWLLRQKKKNLADIVECYVDLFEQYYKLRDFLSQDGVYVDE